MVDKTKSIKEMTSTELRTALDRLRAESEAQNLLGSIQRRSSPLSKSYPGISTEDPISLSTNEGVKSVSIKTATDADLSELLTRLRNESSLQSIIADLKRQATPNPLDSYPSYSDDGTNGVDLNTPLKDLYHYGILGMRWGIRRSAKALARNQSKSIDKDIKSFSQYAKTGIMTRDGHVIMSPDEVQGHIDGLNQLKARLNGKQPRPESEPIIKPIHTPTHEMSDDYMTAEILKTRDYRTMSNAEMNALNQRLQLERSYRSLKTADRQKGLETVQNITKVVATVGALYGLSKTPMVQDLFKKVAKTTATKTATAAVATAATAAAG